MPAPHDAGCVKETPSVFRSKYMPNLTFFDCNCTIGLRAAREPEQIWRTEDFLRELRYHNVHAALAAHAQSIGFNQAYGNAEALKEAKKSERLFPCWTLLPHWTDEFPRPDDLLGEMDKHGVRAARVYPKTHNFGSEAFSIGPLLSALESEEIPLFVHTSELSPQELHDLCQRHPKLPVVVIGLSWGAPRRMFPLFASCPNLHVETSCYQGHQALHVFSAKFGADRILFGTGLPDMSPGAAKANVNYAKVSRREKRLIAGENLARLLRVPMPAPYRGLKMDPIMSRVDRGLPLKIKVIDAHSHLGHDGMHGIASTALHDQSAAAMVESMDSAGIDVTMTSSWLGIDGDGPNGNALVAKTMKRYPGRFLGYATINPNYPETIDAELKRCFGRHGFMGIKPYPPQQQYPLDGPNYRKILECANEHRLPILYHHAGNWKTKRSAVDMIAHLSETYLNAKFMFAHSGSSWQTCKSYVELAKRRPNVFMEITYTAVTFGAIEYMAKEAGADKVIFGTDSPMRDPHPQLAWVAYAKLSVADKRKILCGNFERILADVR